MVKENVKASDKSLKKSKSKKKNSNIGTGIALSFTSFMLQMFVAILFYVIVILLVSNLSSTAYDFCYEIYGTVTVDKAPGTDVTFVVEEGESTLNVAKKLELNQIIVNDYTFFIRTKFSGKTIFPGTYILNTSMSYEEILDVIADYETALENKEETNND